MTEQPGGKSGARRWARWRSILVSDDLLPALAGDDEHLYRRLSVPSHGQRYGTHDHGSIVWDEFDRMWITLMALPILLDLWWPPARISVSFCADVEAVRGQIRWFDRNITAEWGL